MDFTIALPGVYANQDKADINVHLQSHLEHRKPF
jgi:hypothetical protein